MILHKILNMSSHKNFLDEFIKNVKELQDHNEKLKNENIKLREELNQFKSDYDFDHTEVKELSKQLYELVHNIQDDNKMYDDITYEGVDYMESDGFIYNEDYVLIGRWEDEDMDDIIWINNKYKNLHQKKYNILLAEAIS